MRKPNISSKTEQKAGLTQASELASETCLSQLFVKQVSKTLWFSITARERLHLPLMEITIGRSRLKCV